MTVPNFMIRQKYPVAERVKNSKYNTAKIMNIGPGLLSGERSFLVGVYSGGPISGWAYKRMGLLLELK